MMGLLDILTKKGELKSGSNVAKAIHWTEIQKQMKKLTFPQFKEVVIPVLEMFTERDK